MVLLSSTGRFNNTLILCDNKGKCHKSSLTHSTSDTQSSHKPLNLFIYLYNWICSVLFQYYYLLLPSSRQLSNSKLKISNCYAAPYLWNNSLFIFQIRHLHLHFFLVIFFFIFTHSCTKRL